MPADALILELIDTGRQATADELKAIIEHVAQAPFATYLSRVPGRVRRPLAQMGIVTPARMPSVEWHLLERVYLDEQWPVGATVAQYMADLQQAVRHPDVQVWTYRYYGEPFAGFLAPSHVQQVPQPEAYIFVSYSPTYDTITTGYQTSGIAVALRQGCTDILQHR